jgi:ribosomal protein S12 methylthiotransferase
MGRFYDEQAIFQFLDFIKEYFPVHFIRTNVIIGFPGETETDFQKLHSFISQDYFDNIALFEYHDEPLAASFQLPNKISNKVIRSRFHSLRSLVNQLLLARSQARTASSR